MIHSYGQTTLLKFFVRVSCKNYLFSMRFFAACSAFGSLTVSKNIRFHQRCWRKLKALFSKQPLSCTWDAKNINILFLRSDQWDQFIIPTPHARKKMDLGVPWNFSMKSDNISMTMTKRVNSWFSFSRCRHSTEKNRSEHSTRAPAIWFYRYENRYEWESLLLSPQGYEGTQSWQCYLFVSETFEGRK